MLELFDVRYASNRAVDQNSVLTSIFNKRFPIKPDMIKYVEAFETLFSQLKRMSDDTTILGIHKPALLLLSLRNDSILESTMDALCLKNLRNQTWESFTADLIQDNRQIKENNSSRPKPGNTSNHSENKSLENIYKKRTKAILQQLLNFAKIRDTWQNTAFSTANCHNGDFPITSKNHHSNWKDLKEKYREKRRRKWGTICSHCSCWRMRPSPNDWMQGTRCISA